MERLGFGVIAMNSNCSSTDTEWLCQSVILIIVDGLGCTFVAVPFKEGRGKLREIMEHHHTDTFITIPFGNYSVHTFMEQ